MDRTIATRPMTNTGRMEDQMAAVSLAWSG